MTNLFYRCPACHDRDCPGCPTDEEVLAETLSENPNFANHSKQELFKEAKRIIEEGKLTKALMFRNLD